MSDDELKPCPFCGAGLATSIQNASFSGVEALFWHGLHFVNCGTCGAEGPKREDRTVAVTEWNSRADLPPTPAEAMRCPEVMALVEALGNIAGGDPTIEDPEVDAQRSARIAKAALTALLEAVRK